MSIATGKTFEELQAMRADIERALLDAREERVSELRAAVKEMADEEGLSLEAFVRSRLIEAPRPKQQAQVKRPEGKKLPPKYVNPENPKETWSGWATKPKFVKEWLAMGGDLEELRIEEPAPMAELNGARA